MIRCNFACRFCLSFYNTEEVYNVPEKCYTQYYSLIVRFERNTRKYREFIAGIVYECVARVNNATCNERVMFPSECPYVCIRGQSSIYDKL